ncbi:MAG: hypothetical protein QXP06_05375 [Candidatus Bathyarchaeia archaeon]
MSSIDKISKALKSAISYLDNSILSLRNKDENAFSNSVWHVAAELEYALFLFSITLGNGHNVSIAKSNPEVKSIQMDQVMLKVKGLISEAEESIGKGELSDAYKNVYLARHYVFNVQENLTKKKNETNKKEK